MRDGNGGGCMQARMIYLDPYFKGEDLFTLWSHKVVNLLLVDSIAEGKPSTNNLFYFIYSCIIITPNYIKYT